MSSSTSSEPHSHPQSQSEPHSQPSSSHHHRKEKTTITLEKEQSGDYSSATSSPYETPQDEQPPQSGSNILDYFKPADAAREEHNRSPAASSSSTNTDTSADTQTPRNTKKDKTSKNKNKMADTEQQQHQIGLNDDTQSQGGESQLGQGAAKGKEGSTTGADFEKKVAEERANVEGGDEATDEEMNKVELRLAKIIDGALESIRPWLKMMCERCEEAEEKQKKGVDFNEKEFVESMKPIIKQASDVLEKCLSDVKAVDPDKKCQRRAKRNAEDDKASPNQRLIADGLEKLSGEVQKTIEDCKKRVANMPHAKSELDNLFGMLSRPLFQILSAVGLLVYGVLNLLGEILDTLGLGGLFRGLIDGLGLNKLLNALGWKVQLVKTSK